MIDLSGRIAIVTGASRGIGRAIALKLAAQGAHAWSRPRARSNARGVADEIGAAGGRRRLGGARRDRRGIGRARSSRRALATHGRIDILVNNAGIARDQLLLRMKRDDWDAVLATNLTAAFTLTQLVLKPMIRQRAGRIISIGSVVGQGGNAGQANYAASKAGLVGFTLSVALEVASRGITANVVAPGLIDTDMTRAITRQRARGMGGEDSASPSGDPGGHRSGRLLSGIGRGVVYYGAGPGRQWRDVHVALRSDATAQWRAEWPSLTK